jgi:hypothetical protein
MIPDLIETGAPWKVLPEGIHPATMAEVEACFGINPHRRNLFAGLVNALKALRQAGCKKVYLDGSYVTGKPKPEDYDACWELAGVTPADLDPVFGDFNFKRKNQKLKYGGEFFPSAWLGAPGQTFLEFFQKDRFTGKAKGILSIDLTADPMLEGGK